MALTPIKLYRGPEKVEAFVGFADLPGVGGAPLQASYAGHNVNIPNDGGANLTVDALVQGDDLLDLSTPAQPTAKVAGLYIVAFTIAPQALLTNAGSYKAQCQLRGAVSTEADEAGFQVAGSGDVAVITVTVAGLLAVGNQIIAHVANHDGVAARDFQLNPLNVSVIPTS